MQDHRKLAAQVNIALGWIGVVFSVLVGMALFIFNAMSISEGSSLKDLTTGNLLGMINIFAIVLTAIQFLFSMTQLAGGRKLLAGECGITGLMIVSIISLLAFPVGTITGAYTIWVLSACKDLHGVQPQADHPQAEQMAQAGITYNGKYYAVGEMHFNKLDEALEHIRWLDRKNTRDV